MSLVDIHLAPFALRLSRILETHRGWSWAEEESPERERWTKWLEAIEANTHVKATTSGKELYVQTMGVVSREGSTTQQPDLVM